MLSDPGSVGSIKKYIAHSREKKVGKNMNKFDVRGSWSSWCVTLKKHIFHVDVIYYSPIVHEKNRANKKARDSQRGRGQWFC